MIQVDNGWWKRIFDEVYLVTDARTVCDDALTRREVDFLVDTLKLRRTWPILDLCGGQGRHSLEFSRRGFQDVTVLDYSEFLVGLGKKRAREEGLNTRFVVSDARETSFSSRTFKVVLLMANSFGYFKREEENL